MLALWTCSPFWTGRALSGTARKLPETSFGMAFDLEGHNKRITLISLGLPDRVIEDLEDAAPAF